jgi:2'-5' RNA ligase
VLDRLGGVRATVPAAHVTLKAFGSEGSPITPPDEERIAEVVAGWAAASPPIELRAVGLDVFEGDERVPIVRLAPVPVLADLWTRATAAGLPAGYSDPIGANAWIPHLSLAYPDEPDPARWAELVAWARGVDTGELACLAVEAELIVFDGGPQRRLGRFELGGS